MSVGKKREPQKKIYEILSKEFEGSYFRVRSRPKEFRNIYSKIKLDDKTLANAKKGQRYHF